MRLISKTHDYYDSLFRYSAGDRDAFVREKRELDRPTKIRPPPYSFSTSWKTYYYSFEFIVVGFCGDLYPAIRVKKDRGVYGDPVKMHYYYSFEALAKAFPEVADGKTTYRKSFWTVATSLDYLKAWFDVYKKDWDSNDYFGDKAKLLEIFAKEKCAHFIVEHKSGLDGPRVTIYGSLKDVEFFRVFDLTQAHQRVTMFMTNELVKPDDPYIAPVPDKIKAESHGFNKASFRKDPSSKKRKAKKDAP